MSDPLYLLDEIIALHAMTTGAGGITTGYCCECDVVWPCRTYHLAKGWGPFDACFDAGWCEHAGMSF